MQSVSQPNSRIDTSADSIANARLTKAKKELLESTQETVNVFLQLYLTIDLKKPNVNKVSKNVLIDSLRKVIPDERERNKIIQFVSTIDDKELGRFTQIDKARDFYLLKYKAGNVKNIQDVYHFQEWLDDFSAQDHFNPPLLLGSNNLGRRIREIDHTVTALTNHYEYQITNTEDTTNRKHLQDKIDIFIKDSMHKLLKKLNPALYEKVNNSLLQNKSINKKINDLQREITETQKLNKDQILYDLNSKERLTQLASKHPRMEWGSSPQDFIDDIKQDLKFQLAKIDSLGKKQQQLDQAKTTQAAVIAGLQALSEDKDTAMILDYLQAIDEGNHNKVSIDDVLSILEKDITKRERIIDRFNLAIEKESTMILKSTDILEYAIMKAILTIGRLEKIMHELQGFTGVLWFNESKELAHSNSVSAAASRVEREIETIKLDAIHMLEKKSNRNESDNLISRLHQIANGKDLALLRSTAETVIAEEAQIRAEKEAGWNNYLQTEFKAKQIAGTFTKIVKDMITNHYHDLEPQERKVLQNFTRLAAQLIDDDKLLEHLIFGEVDIQDMYKNILALKTKVEAIDAQLSARLYMVNAVVDSAIHHVQQASKQDLRTCQALSDFISNFTKTHITSEKQIHDLITLSSFTQGTKDELFKVMQEVNSNTVFSKYDSPLEAKINFVYAQLKQLNTQNLTQEDKTTINRITNYLSKDSQALSKAFGEDAVHAELNRFSNKLSQINIRHAAATATSIFEESILDTVTDLKSSAPSKHEAMDKIKETLQAELQKSRPDANKINKYVQLLINAQNKPEETPTQSKIDVVHVANSTPSFFYHATSSFDKTHQSQEQLLSRGVTSEVSTVSEDKKESQSGSELSFPTVPKEDPDESKEQKKKERQLVSLKSLR